MSSATAAKETWSVVVEDCTTHHHIELSVDHRDGYWPAMVMLEAEGGTVMPGDARRYALALLAAAEVADQRNEAAFSEPQS
jgi:hypothetical protein